MIWSWLSQIESAIKDYPTIAIFAVTALATSSVWFWNERAKRSNHEYARKEQRYLELCKGIRGCYQPADPDLKEKFIDELNLCWLYCPDDVIKKGNIFLDVSTKSESTREAVDNAASAFMLAIRKDAYQRWWSWERKTRLEPSDFTGWRPLRSIEVKANIASISRIDANASSHSDTLASDDNK